MLTTVSARYHHSNKWESSFNCGETSKMWCSDRTVFLLNGKTCSQSLHPGVTQLCPIMDTAALRRQGRLCLRCAGPLREPRVAIGAVTSEQRRAPTNRVWAVKAMVLAESPASGGRLLHCTKARETLAAEMTHSPRAALRGLKRKLSRWLWRWKSSTSSRSTLTAAAAANGPSTAKLVDARPLLKNMLQPSRLNPGSSRRLSAF